MGEVYRARDSKLGRDVALKILPDAVANDPDRLARFEREARTLAALNHPHIAQIYGLEDRALVMEFVDGEDLQARLERGAIPLDEAWPIARQIAEALEGAHEHGIVHRDLKPANIKIRPDGTVKVLDFGLAKGAVDADSGSGDLLNSPTMPSPAMTHAGLILGTASYMSPEQARGRVVDKRSDIWSFGVVLYEMLTRKRLFVGRDVTEVLAAVLRDDVDLTRLPRDTPPSIARLITRCLERDPRRRLHDIADARIELEDAASTRGASVAALPSAGDTNLPRSASPASRRRDSFWLLAPIALAVAILIVWRGVVLPMSSRESADVRTPTRLAIALPADQHIWLGRGSSIAISPDARLIAYPAYAANASDRALLYVRSLDSFDARALTGTERAANPFFSPDGQWLGFVADGKLKKVPVAGGAVITLAEAPNLRGEAWANDDTILFAPSGAGGLWRIAAAGGGTRTQVTQPKEGELGHRWPQILPDGQHIVYTIWNDTGFPGGRIAIQSLSTGAQAVLVQGAGYGRVVTIGAGATYLLYAREEGLFAAPLDVAAMKITASPLPVLDSLITNLSGGAHYAVSAGGMLVYLPGETSEIDKTLLAFDRKGATSVLGTLHGMSQSYRMSPDGKRLARTNTQGPERDLWIEDLERGVSTRLTSGGFHLGPLWSPDGKQIIYTAGLPVRNLYVKPADSSGTSERLTTSEYSQFPTSISRDGGLLVYQEYHPQRSSDLWLLPLSGERTPRHLLAGPFSEERGVISPDGKWLAYQSNESGRFEIYLARTDGSAGKVRLSTNGGYNPMWSRDGSEVFYRWEDQIIAVSVTREPSLKVSAPQLLFRANVEGDGDVAPDGRFLFLKPTDQISAPRTMNVVLNWFDELSARMNGGGR